MQITPTTKLSLTDQSHDVARLNQTLQKLPDWEKARYAERLRECIGPDIFSARQRDVLIKWLEGSLDEFEQVNAEATRQLATDWPVISSIIFKIFGVNTKTPKIVLSGLPINTFDLKNLKVYLFFRTKRFARPLLHELVHIHLENYLDRNNIELAVIKKEMAVSLLLEEAGIGLAIEAKAGYPFLKTNEFKKISDLWLSQDSIRKKISFLDDVHIQSEWN